LLDRWPKEKDPQRSAHTGDPPRCAWRQGASVARDAVATPWHRTRRAETAPRRLCASEDRSQWFKQQARTRNSGTSILASGHNGWPPALHARSAHSPQRSPPRGKRLVVGRNGRKNAIASTPCLVDPRRPSLTPLMRLGHPSRCPPLSWPPLRRPPCHFRAATTWSRGGPNASARRSTPRT